MRAQTTKATGGFSVLKSVSRENFFEKPDNTIAIYTASCVLRRIGERFGPQGMDRYLKSYIQVVDQREPKLRAAVDQAVSMMNIEKMYYDAVKN